MPDGIGSQGATFQSGQLRSKREKRNRHQAKKKRATTLRHVVAPVIVKLPRGTLTIVQLFARTVGAWNSKKPSKPQSSRLLANISFLSAGKPFGNTLRKRQSWKRCANSRSLHRKTFASCTESRSLRWQLGAPGQKGQAIPSWKAPSSTPQSRLKNGSPQTKLRSRGSAHEERIRKDYGRDVPDKFANISG